MKMNRSERTRQAILNSAEELWAAQGLEGVTLKEIMLHAGCANTTAIQYHFGDRDGLLSALFKDRLKSLEATRAALMATFDDDGKPLDLSSALYCLFMPFAEQRDAAGRRSYAAFQLKMSLINRLDLRFAFDIDAPVTDRLVTVIRAGLPDIEDADFQFRMQLASGLFWQALVILDAADEANETGISASSVVRRVLKMSETILQQA